MLTLDGTTAAAPTRRTVNTPVPMPVDDGIPADLRRAPVPRMEQVASDRVESVAAATGAGMIFLRRSGEHKHWVVQFTGCKAVQCDAVLDVPLPCDATLRDVLGWLGTTYNGKLGGAWLLVAP